jgi:hypothetical protein
MSVSVVDQPRWYCYGRVVASEAFESFAVVGGSGAFAAEFPEVGPGQDVCGGVQGGEDQGGEQASDLVDGQSG